MNRLTRLVVLTLICATPGMAASPIAEVLCDTTERMRDKLERQFGTQQHARGLRGPEQVMEVWTGPRGDWTLVLTYAGGQSCIVAMGEDWQDMAQDPA